MKASLVVVDEFHYSKKGKEINHYKLANKYIIIAPKDASGIKETLKKILPVGIITIIGATAIEFFNIFKSGMTTILSKNIAETANTLATKPMADFAMQKSAAAGAQIVSETTRVATNPAIWQHMSIWFLMRGLAVIILYLLLEIAKNRKTVTTH